MPYHEANEENGVVRMKATARTATKATLAIAVGLSMLGERAFSDEMIVNKVPLRDMKAVFGQVESRSTAGARARIGGTVTQLSVEEGSAVSAGQVIAVVLDPKLALQMQSADARIKAVEAELGNAKTELERGQALVTRGIMTQQRLDQLRTQFDILTNQAAAARSERAVIAQQSTEGDVLAPKAGRVLKVSAREGSVVLAGETIATIASGGYFLRLSLPERHAAQIRQGDVVDVGSRGIDVNKGQPAAGEAMSGRIVKVYPELENGRVIADVEVEGLGDFFVGERALVRLGVDSRAAIIVPRAAISSRHGLDFVRVRTGEGIADVVVVAGADMPIMPGAASSRPMVEILSGLNDGDRIVLP